MAAEATVVTLGKLGVVGAIIAGYGIWVGSIQKELENIEENKADHEEIAVMQNDIKHIREDVEEGTEKIDKMYDIMREWSAAGDP